MSKAMYVRDGIAISCLVALSLVGCVSAERIGQKVLSESEEAEQMESIILTLRAQIEAFKAELRDIRAMAAASPRWSTGMAWVENKVNHAYSVKARRSDNRKEIEILKRRLHGLEVEVEALGEFRRMDW